MTDKSLAELEAYKQRLERDIRRSREMDLMGLNRNTPLVKNFEQVQRDIAAKKKEGN